MDEENDALDTLASLDLTPPEPSIPVPEADLEEAAALDELDAAAMDEAAAEGVEDITEEAADDAEAVDEGQDTTPAEEIAEEAAEEEKVDAVSGLENLRASFEQLYQRVEALSAQYDELSQGLSQYIMGGGVITDGENTALETVDNVMAQIQAAEEAVQTIEDMNLSI